MKITAVNHLNNGLVPARAESLFDQIEHFASYSFCKAHATAYTILSWQCMYMKVNYPLQFFAAALSIEADDTKLAALVQDAAKHDIRVIPPDINLSEDTFIPAKLYGEWVLVTPFSKILGISENTAKYILEARKTGWFKSVEDFMSRVNLSKVNKKVRERLDEVGAFADIQPGALPATHPDRLRKQYELLPGITQGTVKADRKIESGEFIQSKLVEIYEEARGCNLCSLAGKCHPTPQLGKKPKFMAIFDCPTYFDDEKGKMLSGKPAESLKLLMKSVGLSPSDGYYTALVKAAKEGKSLETPQIAACSQYLARELEILKPPAIITLGNQATRYFFPDVKGSLEELTGTAKYIGEYDATVVVGMNPGILYHRPEKSPVLSEAFAKIKSIIE
jgi:DNA polymerase-3 subunit alpha